MNCRSCTLDNAKEAREAALTLLKSSGKLPQEDIDKAIACCECYSDMATKDAAERMANAN